MAGRFANGFGFSGVSLSSFPYRWTIDDERKAKILAKQNIQDVLAIKNLSTPTPLAPCCHRGHSAPRLPLEDDEAEPRRTNINCIPEEILLTIFGLLDLVDLARSVIPVCSRWHRLGKDESLWARETLRYDPLSESPADFLSALSAAPVLGAVEYISDDKKTRQDIAEALAHGCSRILSLTVLQWHQSPVLLRKVLEHMEEHIQHLELFIPDLTILLPISCMNNLRHLILHGEISYVTDLLLKLGTGCQCLTTLDMGGLRFNDIHHLDALMEAVVRGHAGNLLSLKLPPNLTSARVLDAVAVCTKLKVLAIWVTPHITTETLMKSLANLELESLTWRNYDGWLDSVELAQFILYSNVFLKLSEFCLIDCIDMDDGLAIAIAHRSHNLQSLSLHRSELSSEGLHGIITHANHLVSLDLYKNSSFNLEHLKLISSHLPDLQYLDIRRCYNIRSISRQTWESILSDLSHVKVRFD